jgi:hypothetical protein
MSTYSLIYQAPPAPPGRTYANHLTNLREASPVTLPLSATSMSEAHQARLGLSLKLGIPLTDIEIEERTDLGVYQVTANGLLPIVPNHPNKSEVDK